MNKLKWVLVLQAYGQEFFSPSSGQILDKCQLGDIVRQSPMKLDSTGNAFF